jgi:hypothetical protein
MRWQSKDRKAIDVAGGGRPSSMSRGLRRRSVEMRKGKIAGRKKQLAEDGGRSADETGKDR